jgi:alcohol dehydrogenase (NADP+)
MNTPTLQLKSGGEMPALGLGTWKSEPGEVGEAIISAIKLGYRHFDCAPIYENEKEIGEAFSKAFADGLVKREDIWVTSKLWCDNHKKPHVIPALRQTLADLQLNYLDLYLVHWPIALKHGETFPETGDEFLSPEEAPMVETWSGMEECRSKGLTRHIGVSNVSPARLEALVDSAEHFPEVNQVECHPFLNQKELLSVCEKHGVILTAYCPLGSGKREEEGVPDLLENETLVQIAGRHSATPAQIALAWAVCRGSVAIPKSTNESRQQENLEASEIKLSADEIAEIDALDRDFRYIDGKFWTEKGSPYSLEWLWEGAQDS